MIDTNSLSQLASHTLDPRPSTLNTLNAWHIVALGAGAYLAHAYHSIKAAGGIKNILHGLWDGGREIKAESENRENGNAEERNSPAGQKSKI